MGFPKASAVCAGAKAKGTPRKECYMRKERDVNAAIEDGYRDLLPEFCSEIGDLSVRAWPNGW